MRALPVRAWNETDVPPVLPCDLLAALSLWLARERQGIVLVGDSPIATIDQIEKAVIDTHGGDPSRGLSVLMRLRCLVAAFGSHRFRHLVRGHDDSDVLSLVVAAAGLRLNADRGFSPVRLAWEILATSADAMSISASGDAERLVA